MKKRCAIVTILVLAIASGIHATDESLRVVSIGETVNENILINNSRLGTKDIIVRSNEYERMIFAPGMRYGKWTVSSVDLNTYTVELSNNTNTMTLIVLPGMHTNRIADLVSLSTHAKYRVAVGDQLADGTMISEISTGGVVIVESALEGRRRIPLLKDDEINSLKDAWP